jgi:hypothetical protein
MAITISGSGITSANIADGTIVSGDISSSAAIPSSKLDHGTTANKMVRITADGKLPAVDGSSLTNLPASGDTLVGKYLTSTTVSLPPGTYLLVAAGGGGGSHYNSSAGHGGASTVVLGDTKAYGYGGRRGVSNHHTGGSAGGRGGKGHVDSEDVVGGFYARTPVIINQKTGGMGLAGNYGAGAGWSMSDVTKTITTTTTATITVGAGGSTGGNQSYASPGESGFCTIWKVGV